MLIYPSTVYSATLARQCSAYWLVLVDSVFCRLNPTFSHWLESVPSLLYPTTAGNWLEFGRDTREPMFVFFPPVPSVHRMDYICLQLKADCLGPRSGEKFEHSVWLLKTPFISVQGTNVTPAVRTWVSLLVLLLLFSNSLPEICRCASFFCRLVSCNFTLTRFLVINIFLKQTKEEKRERKKRNRRIKKRRKKRKRKKKKSL